MLEGGAARPSRPAIAHRSGVAARDHGVGFRWLTGRFVIRTVASHILSGQPAMVTYRAEVKMRKLATVRKIAEIKPHNNADALELAVVDGWQCVVKKGDFNAGDLVIYFEVDSVLPVLPVYEFLRKGCYVKKDWLTKGEGFRLKTIKLRGEKSQGLVLPYNISPEVVKRLPYCIRSSLEPTGAVRCLFSCQDVYETRAKAAELVGIFNMLI